MKWLGEPVNLLSGQICGQRFLCGNHWISIQAGFLIATQCPSRVKSYGISFGIGASALLDSRHQPTRLNLRFARRSRFWSIHPVPIAAILVSLVGQWRLSPT